MRQGNPLGTEGGQLSELAPEIRAKGEASCPVCGQMSALQVRPIMIPADYLGTW
jgi:hypothetical protein